MNNLLFCGLLLALFVSTASAISCYEHYEPCGQPSACVIEANKKNCTHAAHQYCFKDNSVVDLAVRGCAEAAYCNATVLFGYRYCCKTDYCNQATGKAHMGGFAMLLMGGMAISFFK